MAAFTKRKIACSQSLGEKLMRARKRKSLELRAAEHDTKVAFKYLAALERGQYDQLPAPIYARGFVIRYAEFLGLNAKQLVAEYDHERLCYASAKRAKASKQVQEGVLRLPVTDEWLKHPNRWLVTPGVLWGGVIGVFLVGILTYMWFQVASFAAAPPLDIVTPGSALKVSVEQVEVAGSTDPSAELTINNQPVAVDADGHFRQQVQLVEGMNTIEIAAVNKAEKQTLKTIQLMADLPAAATLDTITPPTETPPPTQ